MPPIAEAFRLLQAGEAAAALALARRIAVAQPDDARVRLAEGIALRILGDLGAARAALERAASLAPEDHAAAYEAGIVSQMQARPDEALARFERARELRPGFFAAHYAAGVTRLARAEWAAAAECFRAALAAQPGQADAQVRLAESLDRGGRPAEAQKAFVAALSASPDDVQVLRAFGQFSVGRGDYRRAASLFGEAARLDPADEALPIFIAQVELLLGRFDQAWAPYARREPRRVFARMLAAAGREYRVPRLAELAGRDVTLVAEQGLGDVLFFLRWAAWIRPACAHLRLAEQPRLHSLLARTGLFESFSATVSAESLAGTLPILVGDLPQMVPVDPFAAPSLLGAPLPEKTRQWRAALAAAGPPPWIGVTWRAGSPAEAIAQGLFKSVPLEPLMRAIAPLRGTVLALQRGLAPGELEAASAALGRPVHDFSGAVAEVEDALAVVTLLDRHIGVSSTNMHLAALAGRSADVLVPFPPEWRWRADGESPWFPGFRVHRQGIDRDWGPALAGI